MKAYYCHIKSHVGTAAFLDHLAIPFGMGNLKVVTLRENIDGRDMLAFNCLCAEVIHYTYNLAYRTLRNFIGFL